MMRRSFIESIGLFGAWNAIRSFTVDRRKLLALFLGDKGSSSRFDLSRFHYIADWVYATDRSIMARSHCRNICEPWRDTDDDFCGSLPIAKAWDKFWQPGHSFSMFKLVTIDQLKPATNGFGICPVCFDRRICFGDRLPAPGEMERLRAYRYDIDDNTFRDPSCELCKGLEYTQHCYQSVCGALIQYRYAKLMAELPGCEVAWPGNPSLPIMFQSSVGISGLVMPVHWE